MEMVTTTLKVFCGDTESGQQVDRDILDLLGEPTDVRKWLAASLDKTIRLQLNPPDELRKMSALERPEWIKQ